MTAALRRTAAALVVLTFVPPLAASLFHRAKVRHSALKTTQRRRLHSEDLIADPGSVEIDIGGLFSSSSLSGPTSVKWTPDTKTEFLRRTEFSASFDSVASSFVGEEKWVTQFSDRVGFAVNHVLYGGENFSFALAPQVSFLLRGEEGARVGAAALSKYDFGLNTLAGNFTWSGATRASETNPAGDMEMGGAYVRRLGSQGLRSRVMAYSSFFHENPTIGPSVVTHSIGCTYYFKATRVVDAALRRVKTLGQPFDNQAIVTLTIKLGRVEE